MANIVRLIVPQRKPCTELRAGHTAEIILFPGVRYERWANETPVKAKRKRKSRAKRLQAVAMV